MFVPYTSPNKYSYTYNTEHEFITRLVNFVNENRIVDLNDNPFRKFIEKTSLTTLLKETAKQLEMRGFKVYTEETSQEKENSFYSDFLENNSSDTQKESESKEKLIFAISWEDDD